MVWISGANVAECAPITTNYVWQAREHGREGHRRRSAHHADRAHLRSVSADQAGPRHRALQRHSASDDRERLARSRVHRATTRSASKQSPSTCSEWTPATHGGSDRHRRATSIRQAAEWWGTAKTSFLMHARGIEHHSHGVQNVLGAINIVLASGRIGRPNCGYATITGQGNGQGGREHGQKCDQLPGGRDIGNPEHRAYVADVWGMDPADAAAAGRRRLRDLPQDRPRRDQGPAEHLFQSDGLAARQQLRPAGAGEARVLCRHRLLHERDAPATPTSFCRARCRKRTKARSLRPKGASSRSTRPSSARATRARTGGSFRTSPRPWAASRGLTFASPARDLRRAARRVQGRHRRLLRHHLREHREAVRRLLAVSERGAGGVPMPPARRGCSSPGRGIRSPKARGRSTSRTARLAST